MATIKKNFDSYKIWYYNGHPYEALIYCYKANKYVGRMVFFKDGSSIPTNANYASGPSIHYSLNRFNDILGILRYEKPLYLFLNLNNFIGHLATEDYEPAGEEES